MSFRKKMRKFWRRFRRKARPVLEKGAKSAARGVYLGARSVGEGVSRMSPRALMVSGSAIAFTLLSVIVLAVALPGADEQASAVQEVAGNALSDSFLPEPTPTLPPVSVETGGQDASALSLDEEIPPAETTAELTTDTFTPVEKGDDSATVATIQSRLMSLGYMDSDEPTQHFGSMTEHALETFQRHNGLADDGVCGFETYQALMADSAKVYVMQLGDEGEDVEGVQQRLYELGYISEEKNITATFGEITESAVKTFQSKNDEKSDGKVGSKTMEALYSENPVAQTFGYGDEDPVILECQKALKKLGYISFTADGEMGRATISAIKKFQQDNGLIVDGTLGPATKKILLSGDAQSKVLQLGDSGSDVTAVQKRLNKLKYLSSGNVTGYFGAVTEDAVRAFQKRNKLGQDGKIGTVTLEVLNSSNARKASTSSSSSSKSSSSGSSSSSSSSSGSSGSSGSGSSSAVSGTGVTKLINLAESKIGAKYVRGAKGPSTFDCSGFVYWCMKNAGVSASYMTSIQWRSTGKYQRVSSMSSIQRGDILVFSGDTDSSGHVGIYIGGGSMIDASSSAGCVRKSSTVLSSGGYWMKHYITAYRVF